MAVMDMDGFKNVNDQYGHRVGDQVLLFFSELLETCFSNRRQSTIGRFGGDEFVVLLKGETDEEWIRQEFEHLSKEFSVKGQERFGFPVSCSIGVTITSKIPPSFASCFIIADRALYSAKKNHGNVCEFVRLDSDDNMRPTMLVVDDDEMTRTLLKTYFKDSFQIIEADNGQDALAEMESYQDMLSIVLMDLEMPVMDGRAVLEELHQMKQLCDIPVLVVTASTDNEMNLRDLGVAGVLNKPFQPEEIKRTVEQTLLA